MNRDVEFSMHPNPLIILIGWLDCIFEFDDNAINAKLHGPNEIYQLDGILSTIYSARIDNESDNDPFPSPVDRRVPRA